MVQAVRNGKDRQNIHEIIRGHSMTVAHATREGNRTVQLFDLLAEDSGIGMTLEELNLLADPVRFVGRAPQQVDEFLETTVRPILAGTESGDAGLSEIAV
jgi:adenylosuccinate lyase